MRILLCSFQKLLILFPVEAKEVKGYALSRLLQPQPARKKAHLDDKRQYAGKSFHRRTLSPDRGRSSLAPTAFTPSPTAFCYGTRFANVLGMSTQKVKTCFTITFTNEQYQHARYYVEDMKKHPKRLYWQGKSGKTDEELIIEQIAHRILSGFYNDDPLSAGRHIMRMDANVML